LRYFNSFYLSSKFNSFCNYLVIAKPGNEISEIEPSFDAYRDVRLLLSTRRNRGNPYQIAFRNLDSIRNSPFDASKPTRVLVKSMKNLIVPYEN